jgi:hypothetical protein
MSLGRVRPGELRLIAQVNYGAVAAFEVSVIDL